jgi:drug efflux transport system ATP-binding protein
MTTQPGADSWSVKVDDLSKLFGQFVAVDRVSFRVAKGEIFGFLGPNGAGKSTVIRMLCGLLTPSGGTAFVAGFDVSTHAEAVRRNLGYMSQKFSLYDDLTVEENIAFFSGIYGVPKSLRNERRDYVLRMAGLGERRNTITRILANGWKQRLALGCAIVHDPPILFLDEPTSGVDPVARRGFWDLIYQLSEAGRTVFVSTHYMDEAEYCHRMALMYGGRIIAMGSPAAVRKERYTRALLRVDSSDTPGTMRALEHEPGVLDVAVFGAGLHVTVEDAPAAMARIREMLAAQSISLTRIEAIEPSMEDVFVSLVEAEEQKRA